MGKAGQKGFRKPAAKKVLKKPAKGGGRAATEPLLPAQPETVELLPVQPPTSIAEITLASDCSGLCTEGPAVRINFPRPVTVKHVYTSEVDPKFRLASFGGNIFCLRFLVLNTRYNPEGHSLTILWSPTVWRTTWRTRGILSLSGLMLICTQSVAHVNLGVLPAARAERQMAGAVSWLWSLSKSRSISLAALCQRTSRVSCSFFQRSSTGWLKLWEASSFRMVNHATKLHSFFLLWFWCFNWLDGSGCRLQRVLETGEHGRLRRPPTPGAGVHCGHPQGLAGQSLPMAHGVQGVDQLEATPGWLCPKWEEKPAQHDPWWRRRGFEQHRPQELAAVSRLFGQEPSEANSRLHSRPRRFKGQLDAEQVPLPHCKPVQRKAWLLVASGAKICETERFLFASRSVAWSLQAWRCSRISTFSAKYLGQYDWQCHVCLCIAALGA